MVVCEKMRMFHDVFFFDNRNAKKGIIKTTVLLDFFYSYRVHSHNPMGQLNRLEEHYHDIKVCIT